MNDGLEEAPFGHVTDKCPRKLQMLGLESLAEEARIKLHALCPTEMGVRSFRRTLNNGGYALSGE